MSLPQTHLELTIRLELAFGLVSAASFDFSASRIRRDEA